MSQQTCKRRCFPRRGTDSNAAGSLERKQAAPGAHSAVAKTQEPRLLVVSSLRLASAHSDTQKVKERR